MGKAFGFLKAKLDRMLHPGGGSGIISLFNGSSSLDLLPRTKFDYKREVGDGLGSSSIMGPVNWIARAFQEAPIRVERKNGDKWEAVENHALTEILNKPNDAYGGRSLWIATLVSWIIYGNAYWIKVRSGLKAVQQLWWIPANAIAPRWNPSGEEFIGWYDYRPGGLSLRKEPGDVVHLRHGIDPRNVRLGISPIESVLRDVFSDDEASNWTASLLRNSGVVGLMVSPKGEVTASDADIRASKEKLRQQFTGDRRGEPFVASAPVDVHQFGFNPQEMDVSALRDVTEERICAALGIPAAVVGFGTGMQQTKVGATMVELKRLAWEGCIFPLQALLAEQVGQSLLPEFESQPENFRIAFDNSSVAVLQDNLNEKATRLDTMVRGGWITVGEARQGMGFASDATHELYLRSIAVVETPVVGGAGPKGALSSGPKRKLLSEAKGRMQARLIRAFQHEALQHQKRFEPELEEVFDRLGGAAALAADRVPWPKSVKGPDEDREAQRLADSLLADMDVASFDRELRKVGGSHYYRVAVSTFGTIRQIAGLSIDLQDVIGLRVIETGGRRLGLVDLPKQTREALFNTFRDGLLEGLTQDQVARRIREAIPAGPWSDVKIRARTIARTETLNAQRVSQLEAYRESRTVEEVQVFDNLTGFDDEDCMAAAGTIVSLEEADNLAADEHPNGTRSFAPVFRE